MSMSNTICSTYEKELEKIKSMAKATGSGDDLYIKWLEAKESIGVADELVDDIVSILSFFLIKYREEDDQQKLVKLKQNRNLLVRTNLLTQIFSTGQFKKWKPTFKNACPKCNGTGELYLFNRMLKEVVCNRCVKGKLWIPCTKCDGTGRNIVRFKKGGGTDSICTKCKDSPDDHKFQIEVVCRTCKGTTIAKIPVLDYSLKSTTICPLCNSLGYIISKPKKKKKESTLNNPVLAGDLALKINLLIDKNQNNSNADTKE